MQIRMSVLAALTAGCLAVGMSAAADWPHWRGPDRSGVVPAEGFDARLTKGAPALWSKSIGVGYTSVVVADGRAYTAGWADGQTTFYCFDAATGDQLWSYSYQVKKYDNLNAGGPSGTAAVDGDRVYHQARDGRLFCYNAQTGEVVYEKDLASDYGVEVPGWGFSGSPVIIGDVLYMDIGRTIALDKATGNEVWKTDDFGPAYSTPAPFTLNGTDYLAVFPSSGLHILERETGREVAHHAWETNYGVHAATPVVNGDRVFISSGYNTGCAMLRFTGDRLDVLWENRNMRNQMPTCLWIGDHLYGFDDKVFKCLDANTGEEAWNERGLGQGTVIAAGDTMVVLSETGELITAPATPEGFRPIARRRVLNEDKVWITPTLSDGKLYARGSRGTLVSVDVSPR